MRPPETLHAAIANSIKNNEKSSGFDAAVLSPDRSRVNHRNETELWDYTETINLSFASEAANLAISLGARPGRKPRRVNRKNLR